MLKLRKAKLRGTWWLRKMWKSGAESFFYSWSPKSWICVCLCTCFKQKHLGLGNVTNLQSQGMRRFIHERSQGPCADWFTYAWESSAGGSCRTTFVMIEQLLIIVTFYLRCRGETTEREPPFREKGSVQGGIARHRSTEVRAQLEWSKDPVEDLGGQWLFTPRRTPEESGLQYSIWSPALMMPWARQNTSTWDHVPWLTTSSEKRSFQFLEQKKKKKFYRIIVQLILKLDLPLPFIYCVFLCRLQPGGFVT